MAKQRLLFIFSLILSIYSFAQIEEADSIAYKRSIIPSLYIDYGKLLSIPSNRETKYEGGFELLFFERFPFIVEVGHATLSPNEAYSNSTYESKGLYYRIGIGYMNQFSPKNKIGITVRYASSTFSENGRISIKSPSGAQKTFVQNIERRSINAIWYEMVVYSDRKISNLFSIGINIRLRILGNYDRQEIYDVYSIPGYGRTFDKTIPVINFFLKLSL